MIYNYNINIFKKINKITKLYNNICQYSYEIYYDIKKLYLIS